jgi:hypothetical protein
VGFVVVGFVVVGGVLVGLLVGGLVQGGYVGTEVELFSMFEVGFSDVGRDVEGFNVGRDVDGFDVGCDVDGFDEMTVQARAGVFSAAYS